MANENGTATPSHDLAVTALEAAVIHLVGQSRAFLLQVEGALHEIGSLNAERAEDLVAALQLTFADPPQPGSVRQLERLATALLGVLREDDEQ